MNDFFCVKQTRVIGGRSNSFVAPGDAYAQRSCSTQSHENGCYVLQDTTICSYTCNTNNCNASGRLMAVQLALLIVTSIAVMIVG